MRTIMRQPVRGEAAVGWRRALLNRRAAAPRVPRRARAARSGHPRATGTGVGRPPRRSGRADPRMPPPKRPAAVRRVPPEPARAWAPRVVLDAEHHRGERVGEPLGILTVRRKLPAQPIP